MSEDITPKADNEVSPSKHISLAELVENSASIESMSVRDIQDYALRHMEILDLEEDESQQKVIATTLYGVVENWYSKANLLNKLRAIPIRRLVRQDISKYIEI